MRPDEWRLFHEAVAAYREFSRLVACWVQEGSPNELTLLIQATKQLESVKVYAELLQTSHPLVESEIASWMENIHDCASLPEYYTRKR